MYPLAEHQVYACVFCDWAVDTPMARAGLDGQIDYIELTIERHGRTLW